MFRVSIAYINPILHKELKFAHQILLFVGIFKNVPISNGEGVTRVLKVSACFVLLLIY